MFLFKTENGFAGININKDTTETLISNCISRFDSNFETLLSELMTIYSSDANFFVFGAKKDSKTSIYKIEPFNKASLVYYDYILYTDISQFLDFEVFLNEESFKKDVQMMVEDNFFYYYLNPPELFYDLFDNEFNFKGRVCGFYGKTIEESRILESIENIRYFLGFEYDDEIGFFQKNYFLDEFRFFKKEFEKIVQVKEYDDIIQISDKKNFLEFIEKNDFINSFEKILENMEPSQLKNDLKYCFLENHPSKKFNINSFVKSDVLDIFFR